MSQRYCACPYCESIFRLPDSKFKRRAGIVRCGSCREVFDSNVNLVIRSGSSFIPVDGKKLKPIESESGASRVPAPESGVTPGVSQLRNQDSLMDSVSEPEIDEDLAVTQYPEQDLDFTAPSYSWNSDLKSDSFNEEAMRDILIDDVRNPFQENSENGSRKKISKTTARIEPVFEPLNLDDLSNTQEGLDEDGLPGKQTNSESGKSLFPESENYIDQFDSEINLNLVTSGVSPDNLSSMSINSYTNDSELDSSSLSKMGRNGVDELMGERKNPFVSFVWLLVTIGFVFLLGLQVKHFFVEKYAQHETYRSYLAAFCKVAGCELPSRQDPFKFTLTHTKIDLHPTQPGAIRVTVKLVNEAGFSQPYPYLQLTLTDKVGRVVGRRTITPALYLGKSTENMLGKGELASILFDLARPHEKAVGFVVDIVTDAYSS